MQKVEANGNTKINRAPEEFRARRFRLALVNVLHQVLLVLENVALDLHVQRVVPVKQYGKIKTVVK